MKRIACLLAVGVAALMVASDARAAEPVGSINQDALAAMGLSGLEVMSDKEGEQVRGTLAVAFGGGVSWYNLGRRSGAIEGTGYFASYNKGNAQLAEGGNLSQTGVRYRNGGRSFTFATGSSFAYAGRP